MALDSARYGKDNEKQAFARIELSRICERKADTSTSAFLKAHNLQRAIDDLKGLREVRDRRRELHLKLADAQADVRDEMSSVQHGTDISGIIEQTEAQFADLDLLESLGLFARVAFPRDPEQIVAEAIGMAQRFVLQGLFPAVIVDEDGRTIACEGPGEIGGVSRHSVIRNEVIHHNLSVAGQIEPAREIILNKKRLSFKHVWSMVKISPFIPPHAKSAVAEGFWAFFHREYPRATLMCVPYLEAYLRKVISNTVKRPRYSKEQVLSLR